jgi:Uma2 family endonuclease
MIAPPMSRRYDAVMSHAIQAHPPEAPAPLRFSRAEFQRMAEAGLFEGRRVELLEGEVIEMTPQGSRHASAVALIVETLVRALSPAFSVRPQLPLALDERSEPEPDVAVCLPDPRHYSAAHPGPEHVVLVIEVADTSLQYDRGRKAAAYARAGIPALWIVDLGERSVEVLGEPDRDRGRYRLQQRIAEDASLVLPNGRAVTASALLPPA